MSRTRYYAKFSTGEVVSKLAPEGRTYRAASAFFVNGERSSKVTFFAKPPLDTFGRTEFPAFPGQILETVETTSDPQA